MSLMDTVKQQAGHAWGTAQHGLGQGQAKFDELRANRQAQALFRNLGAAYYAQQREGGSEADVAAALAALDQHRAAHRPHDDGAVDAPATADSDTDQPEVGTGSAASPASE
jgi:predicted metal-dependent HD superfamily phosphohydrolase